MRIAIGSDHAGFDLKEYIKGVLAEKPYEYEDMGCFDTSSIDYPDIGYLVADAVAAGRFDRGILICGTGVGMSIVANKVHGVRAALCHDTFSARAARQHNNANVLCLGERVIGQGLARDIVLIYLETEFAGGRHAQRVQKICARER